jgi:hypothetical protein
MPSEHRLRFDNDYRVENGGDQPDERAQQRSIGSIQPGSAAVPPAKDDQLLTQDNVFRCEPPTRLERRQQNKHQQPEPEGHTHDANQVHRPMQSGIRFSEGTGVAIRLGSAAGRLSNETSSANTNGIQFDANLGRSQVVRYTSRQEPTGAADRPRQRSVDRSL